MAVERVTIVNPNRRKGVVAATSKAAREYRRTPGSRSGGPEAEAQMPAKNASTQAWRNYATKHRGLSTDQAESLSRDELVARFTEE